MHSRLFAFLLLGVTACAQSTSDIPAQKCEVECSHCDQQSFHVHQEDGRSFTLVFHFKDYRWGVTGTHWYRGQPAFAEYNRSCLSADHVTYHKRQRTIEAWGNAQLEDGSGKQQRFNAVLLKLDNGTLVPIKALSGKEHSAF
jgi:hypothetical protein